MKKPAFTMIELVMVIVVLGILAALAMPRMERDLRQEAGDNILSAIRYTQHLALMDNKTNPNDPNWQQTLWQMRFSNAGGEWFYIIASNSNADRANIAQNEAAIDPTNGKFMHSIDASPAGQNESPDIFLTDKYGISNVDFTQCNVPIGNNGNANAAIHHIAFDYLGRPHRGIFGAANDFGTVMHGNCRIQFDFADGNILPLYIDILQETGYAQIVGQDDS